MTVNTQAVSKRTQGRDIEFGDGFWNWLALNEALESKSCSAWDLLTLSYFSASMDT